MVKHASGKDTGGMAQTTVSSGRHMVWRLTNCVDTVVAGFTQLVYDAGDGVVETFRPGEGAGIVAHAAIGGRRGVVCCSARRISSVMAGLTIAGDAAVIENDGLKIIHNMT